MTQALTTNQSTGALVQTESSRAIQEVQAAMVIAKRFPRDEKSALDRILNACSRQSLAEQALYTYGRGGTDISGPSIRLAEAIAQQWGNLQFGIRELEQRNGESTVEAFAWDVETNTRQVKIFQVPHVRYSKSKGNTPLSDPRDIYELVANQGSRRLRACILGVIPGDIVEEAVRQCDATLSASADNGPEAQKKILEAFKSHGVTKEQIEKRIQRRIDAITPAQVIQLRKIAISIRDGMSSPADWFEGIASESGGKPVGDSNPFDKFPDTVPPEPEKQPAKRGKKEEPKPEPEAPAPGMHDNLDEMPDQPWGDEEGEVKP
jgi:hypothetical protein